VTLAELRRALGVAQRRLIAANDRINAARPDDDLDALEREFADAEAEIKALKGRISRAEAVESTTADLDAARAREAADEETRAREARDAEERARVEAEERAREAREVAVREAREAAVAEIEARTANARIEVTREERTYTRSAGHTFLGDLMAFKLDGDTEARERLMRSNQEMRASINGDPALRAQSTAAGSGGEFLVPELYLPEDYAKVRDAGRPFANAIGPKVLPDGIDEIRVPKVRSGVTADNQTEGNAYATGNVTTGEARAKVQAIGHYNDLSRQVVERSDPTVQAILIEDQLRAVHTRLDNQLINGTGSSPQLLGVLRVSGIETASYTDSTATGTRFVAALATAFGRHVANFQQVTAVLMHPRRFSWLLGQTDSAGRPLVMPNVYPAFNQAGQNITPGGTVAGSAGTILGVSIIVDANVPVTGGASTNQDTVVILTIEDLRLWESTPKVRVLDQPVAHQGQVRVLTYVDAAYMPDRYEKATTSMTGTGLTPPA
jgi:HK97 family phage major capsid protein